MLSGFTVPSPVRSLTVAALLVLAPSSALAGGAEWIVDLSGGAGSHFTDIQSAIAFAQPNDRVLVRAGNYSGFVLDKPIFVRGSVGTIVTGLVRVQNIPSGARSAISRLQFRFLEVDDCDGGVVLESLATVPQTANVGSQVIVTDSDDVRMRACNFGVAFNYAACGQPGMSGVLLSNATLELVSSTVWGQSAQWDTISCGNSPGAVTGGAGLNAFLSTFSLAHSTLRGGNGSGNSNGSGGDGGVGADFANGSRARLAASTITGGMGGLGESCGCGGFWGDGRNSPAVRAISMSLVTHSGVTATGGAGGSCCGPAPAFSTSSNSQIQLSSPTRPTLQLVSANAAGAVTLRVSGPANSTARVWLGRTMITPTPNTDVVGLLTNRARIQNLGTLPAGGQVDAFFTLPSSVETGELVIAQADVLTSTGELLYSNSVCFTRP
jgi:hypothetical protein